MARINTNALACFSSLVALTAAQGAGDAALHLVSQTNVQKYGAMCLDGSAPGYYIRQGSDASKTKWKFHFQGGAWCLSASDCFGRSQTSWGSSSTWPQWLSHATDPGNNSLGFSGIMDANSTINPFGDWNFVWVMYCDGSSYTSNRDVANPVVYNGKNLYMRGAAILDAIMAELEATSAFLSTATDVIISGTSAGGLTAYLHSSYIKSQLQVPSAKLVALPDAGFFLDANAYNTDVTEWGNSITAATAPDLWNSTLRGNLATCLSELGPAGSSWMCYFAQWAYAYIDVPVFVIQSMYDPIQFMGILRLGCDLPNNNCNAQQSAAAQAYHLDIIANVTMAQAPYGNRDGYFLTSCYQHEESCRAWDWYGITINGGTMNTSFYTWYHNGGGVPGTRQVDVAWPGDNTCVGNVMHGAC